MLMKTYINLTLKKEKLNSQSSPGKYEDETLGWLNPWNSNSWDVKWKGFDSLTPLPSSPPHAFATAAPRQAPSPT